MPDEYVTVYRAGRWPPERLSPRWRRRSHSVGRHTPFLTAELAMPSSHPLPSPCHWFSRLASALDPRSAPRLAWLLFGAVLARGRRTVTSWIRAAGLSAEFRPCYTTVSAVGKRTDLMAAHLAHEAVTRQSVRRSGTPLCWHDKLTRSEKRSAVARATGTTLHGDHATLREAPCLMG